MQKKLFYFLILVPNILFAQYYGERTTEQSFEESQIYFNSNFLNPFGIYNFKDVAAGLIDDYFLNLRVNPANLPVIGNDKDIYLYMDFRGDRTEAPIVKTYIMPDYYYGSPVYNPYVNPRFLADARTEPEPIVSFGVITYPLTGITRDFFIGGTYQLIYKEEKFYTPPYWIYNPLYYYDALGNRAEGLSSVPVEDRYSGKDEMVTKAHLFSMFTGYKFTDKLSVGLNISGVTHSREGGYMNNYNDEYSSTNNSEWQNNQSRDRVQNYDHFDFTGGIKYDFTPGFSIGLKAGILDGNADQSYNSGDSYFYKYNTPEVSTEWSYSISNSSTDQNWRQDGTTKYIGFNFLKTTKDNVELRGYYNYTKTNIDVSNSTTILDTSYYTSRWTYNTSWGRYLGTSSAHDIRSGSGTREKSGHEAMFNLRWSATENSSVIIGLYVNSRNTTIHTSEPVNALRISDYHYTNSDPQYNYDYYYSLYEKKTLVWDYKSSELTVQIPVILQFRFGEVWGWMIGVNRILNSWEITDQTTAYFERRDKNENGTIETETNFGERYTQPPERITENFTKFFTSIDFKLSSSFKVRLLLDPEFENEFRLAQWWLSLESFL